MLGEDYPSLLGRLIAAAAKEIQLPKGREDFFQQSGPAPHYGGDQRTAARTNVRTTGLMIVERCLPARESMPKPSLIYTKDFSKNGFGFVAAREYYPGEVVRVLVATFWMRIRLRRCYRIGPNCFECGGILISQSEPSMDAFNRQIEHEAAG
jgi:hypothetical protein